MQREQFSTFRRIKQSQFLAFIINVPDKFLLISVRRHSGQKRCSANKMAGCSRLPQIISLRKGKIKLYHHISVHSVSWHGAENIRVRLPVQVVIVVCYTRKEEKIQDWIKRTCSNVDLGQREGDGGINKHRVQPEKRQEHNPLLQCIPYQTIPQHRQCIFVVVILDFRERWNRLFLGFRFDRLHLVEIQFGKGLEHKEHHKHVQPQ
mmetsp:Transcript_25910/g.40224  ORF Transcript_25910/g.40224 Transcript_25910/m.40224 type:complete len:206 (-) Transcript_25910:101-718(-)